MGALLAIAAAALLNGTSTTLAPPAPWASRPLCMADGEVWAARADGFCWTEDRPPRPQFGVLTCDGANPNGPSNGELSCHVRIEP